MITKTETFEAQILCILSEKQYNKLKDQKSQFCIKSSLKDR